MGSHLSYSASLRLPAAGTSLAVSTSSASLNVSAYAGQYVIVSCDVNVGIVGSKDAGITATTTNTMDLGAWSPIRLEIPRGTVFLNALGSATGTLLVCPELD